MNENEQHLIYDYFHYYTIQQKNLFFIDECLKEHSQGQLQAPPCGREKSRSLTNYHVRRDKAAYAYSSLMTDVNTGWNPAWISLSPH